MTAEEVRAAGSRQAFALLPTGSVEQHGPHLPVGTDALLAEAIAQALATRRSDALCVPPLAYGCSWHHVSLGGTTTLPQMTFVDLVTEVLASIAQQSLVPVVVNGHAGNRAAIRVAIATVAERGARAFGLTYLDMVKDVLRDHFGDEHDQVAGHAGAVETALSLHLWPQAVRTERVPPGARASGWPDPHMFAPKPVEFVRPLAEVAPDGVVGRPDLATPALGKELFDAAVEGCDTVLDRLRDQHAQDRPDRTS